MKYKKKPVVIDAVQFEPMEIPWPEGVEGYVSERTESVDGTVNAWNSWRIETLEGFMEVKPQDWIITGIKGEKYSCKPDIFELTYEPV